MSDNDRVKRIRVFVLEDLESHRAVPNDLLFSRIDRKFGNLSAREYCDALEQLEELGLIDSFDGGRDIFYKLTREGACALTSQ